MAVRTEFWLPHDVRLPREPGEAWDAVEALEPAVVLSRSRTTETAVVTAGGAIVRKRWWWPRPVDRLRGAFRTTLAARSPALREAAALQRLCGLPSGPFAPAPLGWLERRERGVLCACTLLLAFVEDSVDLDAWLRTTPPGDMRRDVLRDLAARIAEMHRAGLQDRDMHPRNVLVSPAARRTWLVDCPKQKLHAAPLTPVQSAVDLGALDVGFVRLATGRERMRFARDYLGASAGSARRRELCDRTNTWRRRIEAREARRIEPA